MKKLMIAGVLALLAPFLASGQKYVTKNAKTSFFSETPIENIEAHNNQVNVALDFSNGSVLIKVLIKSFVFEKALMQEHFNENYMESDKYPTSVFNGKIKDHSRINLTKDGKYEVEVTGNLTIHGVTRPVTTKGTIEVKKGNIIGKSDFRVKLEDYKVSKPKAVAEEISIMVNFEATKV